MNSPNKGHRRSTGLCKRLIKVSVAHVKMKKEQNMKKQKVVFHDAGKEKVTIGKDKKVVITILKIQGDKVSIGIEADKETPIFRNELIEGESQQISQIQLEAS